MRKAYGEDEAKEINKGKGELCELRRVEEPDQIAIKRAGIKVRGVSHWVSAALGVPAEGSLYDRLFAHPNPDKAEEGKPFTDFINPESLRTLTHCVLEPGLADAQAGQQFQFEREGYFCVDPDQGHQRPIFNRTVTLRDSWARLEKQKS